VGSPERRPVWGTVGELIEKTGPIGIDRTGKAWRGASWSVLATIKVRNILTANQQYALAA
jgi:hypothetical protein